MHVRSKVAEETIDHDDDFRSNHIDGDDDNVETGEATEVDNNNDDQPAMKFL